MADVMSDDKTMRGMAMRPVNPPKVTSMVGQGPDLDGEFVVTHLIGGDRERKARQTQEANTNRNRKG